jgi:hypothetical protein
MLASVIPPKRRTIYGLHGAASQKTETDATFGGRETTVSFLFVFPHPQEISPKTILAFSFNEKGQFSSFKR